MSRGRRLHAPEGEPALPAMGEIWRGVCVQGLRGAGAAEV